MKNLKALIKTKSNYKNLNGQWLTVKEFLGSIVACIGPDGQTIDFALSEIEQIKQTHIGRFKILDQH